MLLGAEAKYILKPLDPTPPQKSHTLPKTRKQLKRDDLEKVCYVKVKYVNTVKKLNKTSPVI